MVKELAELGFGHVELSHGIRVSLVPGILEAVEEGLIRVSSVHNFCPLPSGVQHAAPNFYQPSSPSAGERNLWVNYSLKTLEFATTVGARHVIMHSGSAFFFLGNPLKKLEALREQEGEAASDPVISDPAYEAALKKVLKRIGKKESKTGPRITEAYQAVVAAAREKGLLLCIENREDLLEFPTDDRIPQFVEALGETDVVRYWHDSGHAQIKQLQGVKAQEAYLAENADRLAGFHLHDVSVDGRDHRPLGTGVIEWAKLREFMKPEHLYILELNPRVRREDVLASKAFLEDLLG